MKRSHAQQLRPAKIFTIHFLLDTQCYGLPLSLPLLVQLCTIFELFNVEEYRDTEIQIQGHFMSFEMAQFDRSSTSFHSSFIVTVSLSCIVSEIERDISRKSPFFIPPVHNNPCTSTKSITTVARRVLAIISYCRIRPEALLQSAICQRQLSFLFDPIRFSNTAKIFVKKTILFTYTLLFIIYIFQLF